MSKKILSLLGIIIGFAFVLIGILSFSGALGGNTSYPGSAPYSYDSGYASFGADYYTYSVNNTAETASAARTTAGNLNDIANFLKIFCGLFSICFGLLIVCCFGIYRAGLKEIGNKIPDETALVEAEEVVSEETAEVIVEEASTEEVATEE